MPVGVVITGIKRHDGAPVVRLVHVRTDVILESLFSHRPSLPRSAVDYASVLRTWDIGGLVAALAIDMATGACFQDEGGLITEWGFYVGVPLFGLGLAWMGYQLWAPEHDVEPTGALQH